MALLILLIIFVPSIRRLLDERLKSLEKKKKQKAFGKRMKNLEIK